MAAAICCIFSLPLGCATIQRAVTRPYTMARAAQPSASCNPYCSKLIRKSPGNGEKKRPKPPEPRVLQSRPVRRQPPRRGKGAAAGAGTGGASEPGQPSRYEPESGQGVG